MEIVNFLIAMALVGVSWIATVRLLRRGLRAGEVRDPWCACGYPHRSHLLRANRPALIPAAVRGPGDMVNAAGFHVKTHRP